MLGLDAVEAFDVFALTDLVMSNRDHDGHGSLNLREFKSALDSICLVASESFSLLFDLDSNGLTFNEYNELTGNIQSVLAVRNWSPL
ncbi:unnamed protein product [Oikopleura dioica]|uniref:EF-hand domain-containing protein n=1 Tax=Oikopleura dioica TaxID=34765 RepID=E4XXR8_OIKDI|nr:unnamed protein product [Oikopleura dioica]